MLEVVGKRTSFKTLEQTQIALAIVLVRHKAPVRRPFQVDHMLDRVIQLDLSIDLFAAKTAALQDMHVSCNLIQN